MADVEQNAKKKLCELRVIDLRYELDKRGLDRTGVKTALVDRLNKAIEDEGKDPSDYLFDIIAEKTTTKPVKRSSRKLKENEIVANNTNDDEKEKQVDGNEKKGLNKEDDKDIEKEEMKNTSDTEVQENNQLNGNESENGANKDVGNESRLSPPKPETSPVLVPLTVEDVIKLDTSSNIIASDNDSLIVKPDDTQSGVDSSINKRESVDDPMIEDVDKSTETNSQPTPEDNSQNDSTEKDICTDSKPATSEDSKSTTDASSKNSNSIVDSISKDSNMTEDVASKDSHSFINATSKDLKSTLDVKTNSNEGKKLSIDQTLESTPSTTKQKSSGEEKPVDEGDDILRVSANGKNLWVSGLAEKTRASDLKTLFSKFGKVVIAKIVTDANAPGAQCYGFITMATSEEAVECINKLNKTELHGTLITVEKTDLQEPSGSIKRTELIAIQSKAAQKISEDKDSDGSNLSSKEVSKSEEKKVDKVKSKNDKTISTDKEKTGDSKGGEEQKVVKGRTLSRDRRNRDRSRERRRQERRSKSRSRSHGRSRFSGRFQRGGFHREGFERDRFGMGRPFTPERNYDYRFRDRYRSRECDLDRRKFIDAMRQSKIEQHNREEYIKLEREREYLRFERERLEKERAEVLRLERDKQYFEREHIKAELHKRTQAILGERQELKRTVDLALKESGPFWEVRKRRAGQHRESSLEAIGSFGDFGRDRLNISDRRLEFDRSKRDLSPSFNTSGRRESRREHERPRNMPERGRGDWKEKSNRDRNIFTERERKFERPHPWEGSASNREINKLADAAPISNSQWAPVNKPPKNWGRVDQATPRERWGNVDRGQSGAGRASNDQHPPNQINMFGGPPNSDVINQMKGHFQVDQFPPILMRRF